MARRVITIEEKIDRQQKSVAELKAKYETALDELEKLVTKKKQQNEKKLIEAYHTGSKTAEEIIDFIYSSSKEDMEK